jgi:opacity protein-like surface antigen
VRPSTLTAALALFLPAAAFAGSTEADLLAGQHTDAGDVVVSDLNGVLTVEIDTSDSGWELGVSHVYVGLDDPKKHAPGRFPFAHEDLDGATSDSYTIDLSEVGAECGDTVVVAVHTEVDQFLGYEDVDLAAFAAALPETMELVASRPAGHDWFWAFDATDTTGVLDGELDGWCVDTSRDMASNVTYTVEVHSSLDPLAPLSTLVDTPQNLDQVNYIINQDYRSQRCESAGRPYQVGDIQRAIWALVDDTNSTGGLGTWSQGCQDAILADAAANGVGFTPACDEELAVLMAPVDSLGTITSQVVIGEVLVSSVQECVPVVQSETGWAEGDRSFDKGWGMMIDHTTMVCDGVPPGIEL